MRSTTTTLFAQKKFSELRHEKLDGAKEAVKSDDPDRVAGTEKEEYVKYVVSKHQIEPLEAEVDVAQLNAESYKQQEDYQLVIPVAGNTDLLKYRPSTFSMGYSCEADILRGDGELRVNLQSRNRRGWNEDSLQSAVDQAKSHIKKHINRLKSDIEDYHEELEGTVEREADRRREEIREQREMLGNVDVPLRQNEETPDTIAIDGPSKRERIAVKKPEPNQGAAGEPAPTLAGGTYRHILSAINDVGRGFERSPQLFADLDEEDLREHVLFFLERNFEGSATGETFNKQGKTDILLRAEDGSNVFIAECALWSGEKYYTGKIDQLFRYLTWRDSKAAVILFVQNKQMEPVREQIESGSQGHEQFIETVEKPDDSWWQYRFCFPDDPKREIDLGVQAFHVPSPE